MRLRGAVTLIALFAAFAGKYNVRVVQNVRYLETGSYADGKDLLDIYIPEGKAKSPVVLSLYGGSLIEGDKADETHVGQTLAGAGVVTVIANYRLTPTVSHPGHVEDVARAFAWIKKHIAQYGGDPNNVYVIGHSAGAYLAALLALDGRYLAAHGLSPKDIRGVVSVSAFYYVDEVAPDRPWQIWGRDPTAWTAASPATYLRADAPPFLILYADRDEPWRRDQNERMAAAMRNAGDRNVAIQQIADRNHMSIWENFRDGDPLTNAVLAFILKE